MITTFTMLKLFYILLLGTIAPSLHSERGNPFVSGFIFMEKEIWEDMPLTNGEYQISNFGRLRSWLRKGVRTRERLTTPLIMKTPLNGNGYPHTTIRFIETNEIKNIRIHQWVCRLFVPNPNNYPHVLHKDDVKTNCHYSNLEWGTQEKNNQDAFARGLIIPAKGEAGKKSNLTNKDVENIFGLKGKEGCCKLAKKYGVNHTCISDIWTGRTWNHVTGLLCTRKLKPKFSTDVKFKDK